MALAAIAVAGAVAMTGWAMGAPPGDALPSGGRPAAPQDLPRGEDQDRMRILAPPG